MRKGFTLIELLVVVLIMGILASVAMPQYFKSVEKSRMTEAKTALEAIESACERYYMQKGTFYADGGMDTSLSELDIDITDLSYYKITRVNTRTAYNGGVARAHVAQGKKPLLGSRSQRYSLTLYAPMEPGTGKRTWECFPAAFCGGF